MKVAILSESPVDPAAIRILVDAVLGVDTEHVGKTELLVRSWPGILRMIRPTYLDLYYHSDADGLVLMADSDNSPPHRAEHEEPGKADGNCRYCKLWQALEMVQLYLRPRPCPFQLHTAIGMPVPEIAAWYLCGIDSHVNEAAWFNGLQSKKPPYTKASLKERIFGSRYVRRESAIECVTDHARRLAQDLPTLEKSFPIGFGLFAKQLRTWTITPQLSEPPDTGSAHLSEPTGSDAAVDASKP